jgi:MtaA/CmuA family methyltransferase
MNITRVFKMNEKKRLLNVLWGEAVDRPPVICPGGMMSACVTEIIADMEANHNLDCDAMVRAAKKIYTDTGFENYGVPFAMIAEAEPLGIKIDNGNKMVEERVIEYNNEPIENIMAKYKIDPISEGRMGIVIKAIEKLKNDEVPVIGNITGHISTATSVVDPLIIFKMIRKDPDKVHRFFSFVNDYLIEYAKYMIKAGADVIAISDPTATGEILGSKNFEEFAVPYYKQLISEAHRLNVPAIVHICGNAKTIIGGINQINTNAGSFDSMVGMRFAKSQLKSKLMGNVSTLLLHTGEKSKIASITKNCIDSGVDIVSPACGLSMATPIDNLKVMTDFVKRGIYD